MELIDEIKQDRERLKGKPWKEILSHVLEYYKFPLFLLLVAVFGIGSWIYARVTTVETALSGILLNSYGYDSVLSEGQRSSFSEDFLEVLGLDSRKYSLSFRTDLTYCQSGSSAADTYSDYRSLMTIMSCVAADELDFITGDVGAMLGLAYQGYFIDLSEALSEEQYKRYCPYFLYIDKVVLEEVNDRTAQSTENTPKIPDCRKPEMMECPIPVLIDVSQSETLRGVYLDSYAVLAFGMIANMPHTGHTLDFIDYLMP